MKTKGQKSLTVATLLMTSIISMQLNATTVNSQTTDKSGTLTTETGAATAKTETESPNSINGTSNTATFVPNAVSSTATANITDSGAKGKSFVATTYCLKGRTAMGTGVQRGIIAADPRILPLGSRVQISAGRYSGSYLVTDTGSAIKGRRIDIWVPSCGEARSFGRRTVYISPVGRKKKN